MNQQAARLDQMLDALKTVSVAIEFHEHWKPSMAATLLKLVNDAIREEERMRLIDAKDA